MAAQSRASPFHPADFKHIGVTPSAHDQPQLRSGYASATATSAPQKQASKAVPELTSSEKEFTKEHYKNEFHFLRQHGLSIYRDEDREEGRLIIRGLMHHSTPSPNTPGSEAPPDTEPPSESEVENEEDTDHADYNFSDRELNWFKSHWERGSSHFLHSCGLKLHDDEDGHEGKAIVQAFMGNDGEAARQSGYTDHNESQIRGFEDGEDDPYAPRSPAGDPGELEMGI